MNLESHLAQLESSQLIRRLQEEELAYLFKHTLTQETAYESLLLRTRREIHRRVAESIERLYAERLDDFAGILARHYAEAEEDAKTLEYAMRAGDVAARVYAYVEALGHYSLALEVAKRTTPISSPRVGAQSGEWVLRDIFIRRGRMLELSSQFAQALANYDEMEAVGQERGDHSMVLAALMARATIRSIPTPHFDSALAQSLSDQALALARELGDQGAEAKILWNLMLLHSRITTRYREALAYGERSLEIARRLNLREQLAFTLNDLSMVYISLGQPERGKMVGQEAKELWREMNNLPMLADNLGYSTWSHVEMAEFERAIKLSNEAKELSRRIGSLWGETFSQAGVGRAYLELGQPDQAIEVMQEAVRLAEISGFRAPLAITRADLGKLYGDLGAVERGLEFARLAFEKAQQSFPGLRSWSAGALAHLYLLKGDRTAAETIVHQGYEGVDPESLLAPFDAGILSADCELAMAQGDWARALALAGRFIAGRRRVRYHLPEALYLKSRALRGQDELNGARVTLSEARAEAEAQHARWSLWRILATFSEVEVQLGNQAEAQSLRSESRAIVQEIARNIPEELRGGFLELLHVRAILQE